jgi:hypothetical protein
MISFVTQGKYFYSAIEFGSLPGQTCELHNNVTNTVLPEQSPLFNLPLEQNCVSVYCPQKTNVNLPVTKINFNLSMMIERRMPAILLGFPR